MCFIKHIFETNLNDSFYVFQGRVSNCFEVMHRKQFFLEHVFMNDVFHYCTDRIGKDG